jgi:hypothetical protein
VSGFIENTPESDYVGLDTSRYRFFIALGKSGHITISKSDIGILLTAVYGKFGFSPMGDFIYGCVKQKSIRCSKCFLK